MITLNASGGSVTFTFSGNSTYLNDGTIVVPVNSLALIIDESDMVTFRKSASADIFVSANIAEFGMTKDELMAWYKANMVGSTGGGGGVTPEEVEEMIDEAVSGKVDTTTYTAYTADTTPKVYAAFENGVKNPNLYYDITSGITLSSLPISGGDYNYTSIATDASIDANNGVLGVYTTGATHAVIKNDSVVSNRIFIDSIPSSIKMYWNSSYTGNTSHYIAVSCTVNDGTNGYCQWDWNNGQYVPNTNYVNTAVTLTYDSTNQVVTITPSSSSALTSIHYVRCNRNIAPATALTQDNCRIGLVTIDTNSYKLQEALDNKLDANVFEAYSAATDSRLSEDEEVTAAALNAINDRLSEDEEVTAAGLNELNESISGKADVNDVYSKSEVDTLLLNKADASALGGLSLVKLTESEYQALVDKDPNVLYVVIPDPTNP